MGLFVLVVQLKANTFSHEEVQVDIYIWTRRYKHTSYGRGVRLYVVVVVVVVVCGCCCCCLWLLLLLLSGLSSLETRATMVEEVHHAFF